MARVLVTGSADGLGQLAARLLVDADQDVILHARDDARARDALAGTPGARGGVVGDLASSDQTRDVAEQANSVGPFAAVIHNAGIGYRERRRIVTEDGLAHVFAINV